MPYTFSACIDDACTATVDDAPDIDLLSDLGQVLRGVSGTLLAGTSLWVRFPHIAGIQQFRLVSDVSFSSNSPLFRPTSLGWRAVGQVGGTLGRSVGAVRAVPAGEPVPPGQVLSRGQAVILSMDTFVRRDSRPSRVGY